jgi:hypothetical protein
VSYHETATLPLVWSSAIAGLNWLLLVRSSFSLTAGDQVAPASSECWSMMSVAGDACAEGLDLAPR